VLAGCAVVRATHIDVFEGWRLADGR
jgi:hypothetical protein